MTIVPLAACYPPSDTNLIGYGTNAGDYDSIQKAVDAARDGTTVFIPAGHYKESIDLGDKQLSIRGAGPLATIVTATRGSGLTISRSKFARHCVVEDLTIQGSSTGEHLIDIPFGLAQCTLRNLRLIQTRDQFHALRYLQTSPQGGLFDNHFTSLLVSMPVTAGRSGIYVVGSRNVASKNLFERIRTEGGGNYMIHLEATRNSFCYANIFRSINLERCANGGIRIYGGMANSLDSVGVFDTPTIAKDVIHIGRGGGRLKSQGNEIRGYLRTAGQLLPGANDIRVPHSQNSGTSWIEGINSPDGVTLRIAGSPDEEDLQLIAPFNAHRLERVAS